MDDPGKFVIKIAILIFSCVFHECAHVGSALMLGDPTGKERGRLTLNPIPHIDLFWTIILPLLTLVTTGMPFGGPKPAPVDPSRMRNPREGLLWSTLAGPASNILLAGVALAALWGLSQAFPSGAGSYNAYFFASVMVVNLVLAAFNLLPVPPLDGSEVLRYVLGRGGAHFLDSIGRLGVIPMFFALYFLWPLAARPVYHLVVLLLVKVLPHEYAYDLFVNMGWVQ